MAFIGVYLKNLLLCVQDCNCLFSISHFGFYKTGSDTEIVDTKDQETYLTDSIGLRTLDEHGDFIVYNINGVHHTHWHQNKTVFDCCIKQWLT
jgi:hypothetical protein